MSEVRTSVRGLTSAEILRAIGSGARTGNIVDALRPRLAASKSYAMHRTALLRRLKWMEANGLIHRTRYSADNDYHWRVGAKPHGEG